MKYGGLNNEIKDETWDSILITANNDFISVLILWYSGVAPGSTYAWMLSHTLEKYLKAYLLKSGIVTNKELRNFGKNGHSLVELWNKYKSVSPTTISKPKLNNAFEEIIIDLASIEPKIRYSGFVEYSSEGLLYFYIVLCSFLRYLIIGKSKYRTSFYGFDEVHFLPMNYEPMSEGYGKIIAKKMLHLSLEHAAAFTNLGSINSMPFDDYSISNTAIFEKDPECPICANKKLDHLTMIKYYRSIHPVVLDNKK